MKSIYEVAIETLFNIGTEFIYVPCNPIGKENSDMIHLRDATENYERDMHEVVRALRHAHKQEKILNQIKDIINTSKSYVEIEKLIKEV